MNRKGHIGTAILPLLALILFVNALVVMNSFNEDISKTKAEIRAVNSKADAEHKLAKIIINDSINEAIRLADKDDFERSFNESLKDIINLKRVSGINTDIYAKIANGEYSLSKEEGNYVLIVSDYFQITNFEINELKHIRSLKVVFDKTKVLAIE